MEEVSDASSSSDDDSNSEDNDAVSSGWVYHIDSNIYLGINMVSYPENLVYATLDWEHVSDDPMYK